MTNKAERFAPVAAAGVGAVCGALMPSFLPVEAATNYSRFGYALQSAFFASAAYRMARSEGVRNWIKVAVIIAAVSAFFAWTTGTHSEGDEDSMGERVTDFVPTDFERGVVFGNDVIVMLWGAVVGAVAHSKAGFE